MGASSALPQLLAWGDAAAGWLVRTSWQAAVLVGIVALLHALLGRRLAPRWRYAMWMLVVVRLLMPAVPESRWSVFNLRMPALEPRTAEGVAVDPRRDDIRSGTRITYGLIATTATLPDAPSTSPAPPFDWRTPLIAAWLAGVAIVLGRMGVGVVMLGRRLRHARPLNGDALDLLDECRREMGLAASPRACVTDAVPGPALFGFIRPRLLIPSRLLRDLTRGDLRFVLLHELAHVRRRDALANALLVIAQAVHWFNPVVRFALARCRAERELACDALVMSVGAASADGDVPAAQAAPPAHYGRAVLRVAESFNVTSTPTRRVPVAAVGMIHTRSQLHRRIAMIATFDPAARATRRSAAASMLLVLCLASCALTDEAPKKGAAAGGATPPLLSDTPVAEQPTAGTGVPAAAPAAADPAVDPRLQAALDRSLPELRVADIPLVEVLDHLATESKINLIVDWRSLEAAGIDRNAPVTARLRDVPLSHALQIVLDDVGGDTVRMGYDADGNVLTVATTETLSRRTVTRVYAVADLMVDIPSITEAPALGQSRPLAPADAGAKPAPDPNVRAPADDERADRTRRAERVEQIVTIVKETIDPGSWRDNGGSVGAIRELNGQLVVTQTRENHRQLAALLDQLRQPLGTQVTVEARFVTLDLAQLPAAVRDRLVPSFRQGEPGRAALTDEDVQAILKATHANPTSTIVTAPRITLFNGQRGYVNVSTDRAYVSGYVTRSGGDVGDGVQTEPQKSVINTGVMLDVAATEAADGKQVTLTLRPKLATLVGMEKTVVAPNTPGAGLTVEHPNVRTHSLQTTVTIPDRQTLLLGGFVENPDAPAGAGATTKPVENLYMLVKPTLIVSR